MPRPTARPFLLVNMAMSADGKIASADRRLTTFGSPRDEEHLYELRSGVDAILCGARTIEQSRSTLGNGPEVHTRRRLRTGRMKFPVRVIVTGSGSIDPDAELWQRAYGPIVIATTSRAQPARLRRLRAQAAMVYQANGPELDWPAFLLWLRHTFATRRVLSEGGGELNDALFRAGVIDELHLTWCPLLLGGRTAPTIADGHGVDSLSKASAWRLKKIGRWGDERSLIYHRDRTRAGSG